MASLTGREIKESGTPDAQWLPWLAQQDIRQITLAGLAAQSQRLVVLAPHPDDEILACGGLLAGWVQQGHAARVIAVTDGEASHGMADSNACARMGARRAEESYAGLRALGLAPACVTRLGIADGRVSDHVDALAQRLETLLQPTDLVVTTWRFDGHPDHEATGLAASRACGATGARLLQAPVWMWHWSQPADTRVPWQALHALSLGDAAMRVKWRALQCHQSQLARRGDKQDAVLVPSIVERNSRRQEFFFL
ncbi:MAG: PIG-L family deacetylase [Pseudomonadota bacterium]